MTHTASRIVLLGAFAAPALAQSFADLTEVRNPANPYYEMFEIEAGAVGCHAGDEDETVGLKSDTSWDGHAYYRNEAFSSRRSTLEAYAGRDGLFAGWYDGKLVGDQTTMRLEGRVRPWNFYRDGYYDGSNFVPRGLYEGRDYEGYLGFGKAATEGLYIELGPYYRKNHFSRSDLTRPDFTVPDNYAAYGGRMYVEQDNVQMDRRRGMPQRGYILTLMGEREWNGSDGQFGADTAPYELPSAVWRLQGRLEWYIPSSDVAVWEIFGRGGWTDKQDRVVDADSSHPLGNQWADAQLRLRFHLGKNWTLTPFVEGQYSKLIEDDGLQQVSQRKFFVGGGVETYVHLSDAFSIHGYYSYLDNESRPSIRVDEDVHGEHVFYLGLVMRFGGQRH